MVKSIAFLIGFTYCVAVCCAGSVPFFKDVMKNFTKDELMTVDQIMTSDQHPADFDFGSKFDCDTESCDKCVTFKLIGQPHEICVKKYNYKAKPSGVTALFVDGKKIQELGVFNRYCDFFWGKVAGCMDEYGRDPKQGRYCHKVDVNLLFSLITFDFNCFIHKGEELTHGPPLNPHSTNGIILVDVFAADKPQMTIRPKDAETVELVRTAIKELIKSKFSN